MPSARPTITMARPNISGRSLIAASAAAPVYATAIAAPIDEPATAIAAAMSAVPPAPEVVTAAAVELTCIAASTVVEADAGIAFNAVTSRPRATMRTACLLYTSDAADEEDSVDLGG